MLALQRLVGMPLLRPLRKGEGEITWASYCDIVRRGVKRICITGPSKTNQQSCSLKNVASHECPAPLYAVLNRTTHIGKVSRQPARKASGQTLWAMHSIPLPRSQSWTEGRCHGNSLAWKASVRPLSGGQCRVTNIGGRTYGKEKSPKTR